MIFVVGILGSFTLGAWISLESYNRPIENKTAHVLTNLVCHKNDGLKSFRRGYWDAKKFVVKCKDTATFEQIGFTPEFEQVQQEKETDNVKQSEYPSKQSVIKQVQQTN
jgi:hypothetical protein